jgi:O-antigen/teichoic acid export membrane protein
VRTFASNSVGLASGSVLTRVIAAVILILLARRAGPGNYGLYAAAFALLRPTAVLFALGLDIWLLRNGNLGRKPQQLAIHTTTVLLIKLGLGGLWLLVVSSLAFWVNHPTFPPIILGLCALCIWFEEITNTIWTSFKTLLENWLSVVISVAIQLGWLGCTVLLFFWPVFTLLPYLLVQLALTVLGALIAYRVWQRRIGWHFDRGQLLPTWRATLPFGLSVFLAYLYGQADIVVVTYQLGSYAGGIYSSASTIVNGLSILPAAIYYVIVPMLSQLLLRDLVAARAMLKQQLWLAAGLGLLLGLATALIAAPLIPILLGAEYVASSSVLLILAGVIAGRCLNMTAASALVAANWQTQRLRVQLVVAALNIGLNLLIVQRWQIMGVAIVYVCTEWILALGYLWLLWRWQPRTPLPPPDMPPAHGPFDGETRRTSPPPKAVSG